MFIIANICWFEWLSLLSHDLDVVNDKGFEYSSFEASLQKLFSNSYFKISKRITYIADIKDNLLLKVLL